MRISKDPQVRKQEILDTAMRLFYEKGYEATSMADIAKEMDVVKGLCYRYFDSKQTLFQEAMDQYVVLCCAGFIQILHRQDLTIQEKIDAVATLMSEDKAQYKYHDFFHKAGNEELHEQLTIRMCKMLAPHIIEEVKRLEKSEGIKIQDPEMLVHFLLFGQVGMMFNVVKEERTDPKELVALLKRYAMAMIHNEILPAE